MAAERWREWRERQQRLQTGKREVDVEGNRDQRLIDFGVARDQKQSDFSGQEHKRQMDNTNDRIETDVVDAMAVNRMRLLQLGDRLQETSSALSLCRITSLDEALAVPPITQSLQQLNIRTSTEGYISDVFNSNLVLKDT